MPRIRPSGGYRELRSFQIATLIYDATYWFCERFVDPRSRTSDQMIQAARSGRQNIAEGSRASAASSQTELRLVNVARSLEVRNVGRGLKDRSDLSDPTHPTDPPDQAATRIADDCRYARYARWLDHELPEIRANAIICLIHQANYLLDRQIEALERQFVEAGGYSEQLATARMAERAKQRQIQADRTDPTDPSNPTDPVPQCPRCQALMVLRTAKSGPNAGQQFWGCASYPECKGTVRL